MLDLEVNRVDHYFNHVVNCHMLDWDLLRQAGDFRLQVVVDWSVDLEELGY